MKLPFFAGCPSYVPDLPDYPEETLVAVKTLSVSAAITQNPAGAPTPQAIIVAISEALDNAAFGTAAPWTAVVTITSS